MKRNYLCQIDLEDIGGEILSQLYLEKKLKEDEDRESLQLMDLLHPKKREDEQNIEQNIDQKDFEIAMEEPIYEKDEKPQDVSQVKEELEIAENLVNMESPVRATAADLALALREKFLALESRVEKLERSKPNSDGLPLEILKEISKRLDALEKKIAELERSKLSKEEYIEIIRILTNELQSG